MNKDVKSFLTGRHAKIQNYLTKVAPLYWLEHYDTTALPNTNINFHILQVPQKPLVLNNYSISLEEILRSYSDEMPSLIKYSIKIMRLNASTGADGEILFKYDYSSGLSGDNSSDDHDDPVWIDLPHVHFHRDKISSVPNLAKIHFPTYIAPDGLAPFRHGNDINLYHLNFVFNVLEWVRLELLPRLNDESNDARRLKYRELISSLGSLAGNTPH